MCFGYEILTRHDQLSGDTPQLIVLCFVTF